LDRIRIIALVLIAAVLPACAALKDREPFLTPAITLTEDPVTGQPMMTPDEVTGSWSYGRIQIENSTGSNYYFVQDDLAIYQLLPRGEAPIVSISEAKDGRTYIFYLAKEKPESEIRAEGKLHITYTEEDL
jgi:hypothetical protein